MNLFSFAYKTHSYNVPQIHIRTLIYILVKDIKVIKFN